MVNLFKTVLTYKGFDVTTGAFGFEVYYNGDDYVFSSHREAKKFIDEVTDGNTSTEKSF